MIMHVTKANDYLTLENFHLAKDIKIQSNETCIQ